jgi:hypothetical protein
VYRNNGQHEDKKVSFWAEEKVDVGLIGRSCRVFFLLILPLPHQKVLKGPTCCQNTILIPNVTPEKWLTSEKLYRF